MYCLYITITVCLTGVLLATVGVSSANSAGKDQKTLKDDAIADLVRLAKAQKSGTSKNLRSGADTPKVPIDKISTSISEEVIGTIYRPNPDWQGTGVALIKYEKTGVLCSGVHLKPWIVLTVADCVQGRNVEEMTVDVKYLHNNAEKTVSSEVKEVIINPKYIDGAKEQNNLAILIVYSHDNWRLRTFRLPEIDYTTEILSETWIPTYVDEWVTALRLIDYKLVPVKLDATTEFKLCGSVGDLKSTPWYCVDRTEEKRDYKAVDLGTPFYLVEDGDPYCLGLYTGMELRKSEPGILYLSIYPDIDWIKDQVHQHPQPPV